MLFVADRKQACRSSKTKNGQKTQIEKRNIMVLRFLKDRSAKDSEEEDGAPEPNDTDKPKDSETLNGYLVHAV